MNRLVVLFLVLGMISSSANDEAKNYGLEALPHFASRNLSIAKRLREIGEDRALILVELQILEDSLRFYTLNKICSSDEMKKVEEVYTDLKAYVLRFDLGKEFGKGKDIEFVNGDYLLPSVVKVSEVLDFFAQEQVGAKGQGDGVREK